MTELIISQENKCPSSLLLGHIHDLDLNDLYDGLKITNKGITHIHVCPEVEISPFNYAFHLWKVITWTKGFQLTEDINSKKKTSSRNMMHITTGTKYIWINKAVNRLRNLVISSVS